MNSRKALCMLSLFAGMASSSCAAPAESPPTAKAVMVSGWYMQHGRRSSFQPCGEATPRPIAGEADLRARAKAFDLDEDTPVYVRLELKHGLSEATIDVLRVAQFGSPTPVRNCSMTGVVNHEYASALEQTAVSTGKPAIVLDIAPAAVDAVKVVDAFSAAIKAVKISEAGDLMDAKALILESGGSERSRDEYLQSHAIADAAFMQNAKQELRYRQAQADGNVAWVGTESILQTSRDGKPMMVLSTETMVLSKGPQGWKIVHIHWSSRAAPKG
jgi:hypothetical protein